MNKDLTIGEPQKVLWKFCLPLFGSILFQQLYNIADSLVAGKFIGENALAAVGNSYEITLIFLAFATGLNIACSVLTSQLFGAKDYKQMKSAISTSMIITSVICLILMLIGICGGKCLLTLINTPESIMADSNLYLAIYSWGLPFLFFYNISNGIFSALGDSKTPFYFLAVSSSSNILVDIYFVAGLKMGVAGVAWATFLCQGASCLLALIFVLKRLKKIKVEGEFAYFSWPLLKRLSYIAIPSILQQSFISLGNIVIQSVINGYGAGVIAGYAASIKLNNLVTTSFTTLGNGISNYTAQNMGAQKFKRVKAGFKAGLKLVWMICVPIVLLYFFGGKYLIEFFMDEPSSEALNSGVLFLRIVSPFYFFVALKLTADGTLRGMTHMKEFMIDTFLDLGLRVILVIILSKKFGVIGIWSAWPFGWVIATLLAVWFYKVAIRQELVED